MTCALNTQAASTKLSWLLLARAIKRPLLLLVMSLGFLIGLVPLLASTAVASTTEVSEGFGLEDGTYVFGEAPEAGRAGMTYMVFAVESHRVVGAFYQPSSSFDCFHGTLDQGELALTVVNSYDQQVHPYALALSTADTQVASQGDAVVGGIVPEGFHRLSTLSELDQDVLATCQASNAF